jgi:hypothetical protein
MTLCSEEKQAPEVVILAVVRKFHILDTCNESHAYSIRRAKIECVSLATVIDMEFRNTAIRPLMD